MSYLDLVDLAPLASSKKSASSGPPLEEQARATRFGGIRSTRSTATAARALTPGKIARMLGQADDGDPSAMFRLLHEMEDRDPHLVSVLGVRKRAVANLSWELEPAGERRRDRKVAEFCTEVLEGLDDFEGALVDQLDAISKGISFAEIFWQREGSAITVEKLQYRPQYWFTPDEEDPECWRLLDQADSLRGIELEPRRFMVHQSKAKSGFPVRAGLGRVLTWWYLFANYAVKDWVSYSELYGSPFRVGKFPVGSSKSDIDDLFGAVKQLGIDAAAVIPADMDVEFITAGAKGAGGVEVYAGLRRLAERLMSKAVLGQTLTTDEGKSGSRALGLVHNEVRQDIVVSDAKQLARTLRRDLLEPLVEWNFGPDVGVPKLVFDAEPPADEKVVAETQEVRARVFLQAVALGVPVPLAQAQEELGIRDVAGDELVLVRAPETTADPTSEEDGQAQGAGRAEETAGSSSSRGAAAVPARLGASTSCADKPLPPHLAQVQEAVDRYRTAGAEAWAGVVEAIQGALLGAGSLEGAQAALDRIVGELGLEELEESLSDALMAGELTGRGQAMQGDGSKRVVGLPAVPPREAAAWWQDKLAMTAGEWAQLERDARSRAFTVARFTTAQGLEVARQALEDVIAGGGTFAEFEDAMDVAYRREGLAPDKAWRLETVYRNNVFTAYSVGRTREQLKHIESRPYARYNSLDDGDVRPAHAAMDDRVYPLDHEIWQVWNPPNGHACRCYRTTHTAAEVAENGWTVESELPIDIGTGRPMVPDRGWDRDPAREPHEFDWDRFPESWRKSLGVAA